MGTLPVALVWLLVAVACTEGPSAHPRTEAPGSQGAAIGGAARCGPAEPRGARPTRDNGKIAFASDRDGDFDIYVMNSDGSDQHCLVDTGGRDLSPAWSPDGNKLAFTSSRDGERNIYVVNADGSRLTRLTDAPGYEIGPSWSPDGAKIVFQSYRPELVDGFAIMVVNADGTGLITLQQAGRGFQWVGNPRWSPDGAEIAFAGAMGGWADIFIMDADGTHVVRLTHSPPEDLFPAWSPDGTKIAFQSDRGGGCIYVMNQDGSGVRRLRKGCVDGVPLAWSPDGRRIAWGGGPHGPADVFVMNADGSHPIQLTHSLDASYVAWQPAPLR